MEGVVQSSSAGDVLEVLVTVFSSKGRRSFEAFCSPRRGRHLGQVRTIAVPSALLRYTDGLSREQFLQDSQKLLSTVPAARWPHWHTFNPGVHPRKFARDELERARSLRSPLNPAPVEVAVPSRCASADGRESASGEISILGMLSDDAAVFDSQWRQLRSQDPPAALVLTGRDFVAYGALDFEKQLGPPQYAAIPALPEELGDLPGLQALSVVGCKLLRTLPATLSNLQHLRSLRVAACVALQRLPDSLGLLTKLRALSVTLCLSLTTLPDAIGDLVGLRELDLSANDALTALPASICALSNLQSLKLHGCDALRALPLAIGDLGALTALDLSMCSALEALPEGIGRLRKLQTLSLARCRLLRELPTSFRSLQALRTLDLTQCSALPRLPAVLVWLPKLQVSGSISGEGDPEAV